MKDNLPSICEISKLGHPVGSYVILHFKEPHNPRGSLSLLSSSCLLPADLPDSLGSFSLTAGWLGVWLSCSQFPPVATLETVSQNALPWAVAISSSSAVGKREPSAPCFIHWRNQPRFSELDRRKRDVYRKRPSSPCTTAMHLIQIRQHRENSLIPQRHIDKPMMRKRTHRSNTGTLLPTTQRSRRDK